MKLLLQHLQLLHHLFFQRCFQCIDTVFLESSCLVLVVLNEFEVHFVLNRGEGSQEAQAVTGF